MRQRAAESDIVIVNHHLLCADASVRQNAYGEVIPECHVAVIDEAHQLEDVATQYFGMAVSTYRVEDLVRDVERLLAAARCADDAGRDAARERPASATARRSSSRRCATSARRRRRAVRGSAPRRRTASA